METKDFKKGEDLINQGQSVSAGVCFFCIEADNFRQTREMILLK